jgi:S1-C subfamily serine protease
MAASIANLARAFEANRPLAVIMQRVPSLLSAAAKLMHTTPRLLVAAIVVLTSVACGRAQDAVAPGYLGLMLDDRPWDIDGVPVMRVHPRTPAALAGFQVGDIVVTCNGARIRDVGDFARAIYQVPVGGQAVIEVQRGGNLFELTATLSDVPNTHSAVGGSCGTPGDRRRG